MIRVTHLCKHLPRTIRDMPPQHAATLASGRNKASFLQSPSHIYLPPAPFYTITQGSPTQDAKSSRHIPRLRDMTDTPTQSTFLTKPLLCFNHPLHLIPTGFGSQTSRDNRDPRYTAFMNPLFLHTCSRLLQSQQIIVDHSNFVPSGPGD